jgi:hypothetical protein
MLKSLFEDELISGMQQEMHKQASAQKPSLVQAAECLHAALEIFEEQGLTSRADQVLNLLQKIAQTNAAHDVQQMPSIHKLMEAGLTQRDMHEFSKGSPIAKAKFNIVLRTLGYSDHQIGKFIGPSNVMSEDDAKQILDPNRSFGKIQDWMRNPTKPVDPSNLQPGEEFEGKSLLRPQYDDKLPSGPDEFVFKSIADSKKKVLSDRHTKGLTPEKEVANYKKHGTPFNMADDACAIDVHLPVKKDTLSIDDMEADFADMLNSPTFDIDASDDELMGMEIKEDSLEVFDDQHSMEDFEDERD